MKILFILILSSLTLNCKFEDLFDMQFYSVFSYSTKILKLDEGELVFYGYEGNILRTYDNGNTWQQNYSGTHQNINKLIYFNNTIFGVTDNGSFMSSDDKGDWWSYSKLSNGFSDITSNGNELFLSTKSDSIFVSSDFGKNWQKHKLNIDSILNIGSVDSYLIIHTVDGDLYKTNSLNDDLELIEPPFQFNNIEIKNNNFYIKNGVSVAKLKSDFTWEVFEFFSEPRLFVFLEEEDEYVIFAPNVSSPINFGLEIFKFNKSENSLNLVHKYFNNNFNFSTPANFEMYPNDVTFSNGEYILSNYFKTILKSSDLLNWDIIINGSYKLLGNTKFYNDRYIYSKKQRKSNLLKSTDGGITFQKTWDLILDTIENKEYIPSISDYVLKDENKGLVLFEISSRNLDGSSETNYKRFLIFENDKVNRLDYFIPYIYPSIHDIYIENFYSDDYLVYSSHLIKKTEKDENNQYKDSIVKNVFYRLNENELDTLGSINDSIQSFKILYNNGIVWFWGKTNIPDENNKRYTKFYYSLDSCKTFNLSEFNVIGPPSISGISDPVNLLIDKNGNYYVITNEFIDVYDKDFNNIKNIPTQCNMFNIRNNPSNYIEDAIFTGVKFKNGEVGNIEKQFYCYINENNEIIEIREFENDLGFYLANDSESYYKIQNAGYILISKPIEPERLEYYSSVQKTEKRNYLWTEPPYPQPTNNIVKIDTYWDSALPFTEEHIEIYNLTGIKIKTENTLSIQKESAYNGKIIWDASNQQPGIYILKINHGTETRVRKIMVVE